MSRAASVSVFYTAELRGDLDMLPRIVTRLRGLRAEFDADRLVQVDLGAACAPDVWHCDATDGRSMVLALDGIGWDAINVGGYLSDAGREKLMAMGDSLRAALFSEKGTYWLPGLDDPPLGVVMGAARTTQVFERLLYLCGVGNGEIGFAHCVTVDDIWRVESSGVYAVPPSTPPDSTASGLVEFIRSEASAAARRKK